MPKKPVSDKVRTSKKTAVEKKELKKPKKTQRKPVTAKTSGETKTEAELNDSKKEIIEKFQLSQSDTGSPEVQIALLTARIDKLIAHLKINPSDNHSRRGLLGIVSKRRRLLNYLEGKDKVRFKDIAKKLELGK